MVCATQPVIEITPADAPWPPMSVDAASAIEHLLDVGLEAVPDLVEHTIQHVAKP